MIKALGIMWRAWAILLPVVVINSGIQALIVIDDPVPGLNFWFVLDTILSFVAFVAAFCLISIAMLQATAGGVRPRVVLRDAARRFPRLLLWGGILLAAVTVGLILFVVPGLLVLVALPYLLIAVADGERSPIVANFRAIKRHWVRWLVMVIGMAIVCFVIWLLTALNAFFISGPISAFIAWIVLGLIASWFICAWARVWRLP